MAKTNWGAGLSALGQGLEGIAARMYAEKQQREQQARQDQMLAEQRAYAERMYTQRLNETDPLMPVPAPVANFVGLPEHQVGPMPNMNLPQYERTSVVSKWNNMLPRPTTDPNAGKVMVTDGQGRQYWVTPDKAYSINNPEADVPAPMVPVVVPEGTPGFPDGGQFSVPPPSAAGIINALKPDQTRSGPSIQQQLATEQALLGGYESGVRYDPKTQTGVPFQGPVRGVVWDPTTAPIDISSELAALAANARAAGNPIDTEQEAIAARDSVLQGHNLDLATQMNIDLSQMMEGWRSREDDPTKMYKPKRFGRDPVQGVNKFYQDVVNKALASGRDEVSVKTVRAWAKKQGISLEELMQDIDAAKAAGFTPAQADTDLNEKY